MRSLDDLLTSVAVDLPRETSLVSPVMVKIKQRQTQRARLISRSLLGCLAIGLLAIIGALLRGNAGKVVALAVHKFSSVPQHPALYLQALIETLPWPIIATVAGIALLARIMQRNKLVFARHATAAMATLAGALLVTATATAATITTVSSQAGPAQQQLERTINGLGKQEVTVDGVTYELAPGQILTDNQIRAQAELDKLGDVIKTLNLPKASDGGYSSYFAYVVSLNGNNLKLTDTPENPLLVGHTPETPAELALDSQTVYLKGVVKTSHIDLNPGDLVDVAVAKDLKTAGFVSKLTYPLDDYRVAYKVGFAPVSAARRTDGKCYNNVGDLCPNLPAVHDLIGLNRDSITVPSDGVIREVFGQLVSYAPYTLTVKTSSGAIWTFSDYGTIGAVNQYGLYDPAEPSKSDLSLQVKVGDYMRVEFWQHTGDLDKREVINQGFSGTKDEAQKLAAEGKLPINPEFYIRSIQLALKQPWYAGQTPVKYQP